MGKSPAVTRARSRGLTAGGIFLIMGARLTQALQGERHGPQDAHRSGRRSLLFPVPGHESGRSGHFRLAPPRQVAAAAPRRAGGPLQPLGGARPGDPGPRRRPGPHPAGSGHGAHARVHLLGILRAGHPHRLAVSGHVDPRPGLRAAPRRGLRLAQGPVHRAGGPGRALGRLPPRRAPAGAGGVVGRGLPGAGPDPAPDAHRHGRRGRPARRRRPHLRLPGRRPGPARRRLERDGPAGALRRLLLDPGGHDPVLPQHPPRIETLPRHHLAAQRLLPEAGTGRAAPDAEPGGRERRELRRGQGPGAGLEGAPGRLLLHRVRPLPRALPHAHHRQAAVAQADERPPEGVRLQA